MRPPGRGGKWVVRDSVATKNPKESQGKGSSHIDVNTGTGTQPWGWGQSWTWQRSLLDYCCLVTKSCLILCDPMDRSPPARSVHEISQARTLEWVAIFFSRGSFRLRDGTRISCTVRWILYQWATRAAVWWACAIIFWWVKVWLLLGETDVRHVVCISLQQGGHWTVMLSRLYSSLKLSRVGTEINCSVQIQDRIS